MKNFTRTLALASLIGLASCAESTGTVPASASLTLALTDAASDELASFTVELVSCS